MKIAIIGGTGLLGSNLLKLYSEYDIKSFSREQSYVVDYFKNFTVDFRYLENELIKYFIAWKPDVIINTVAVVNLQKCEDDYNYALEINCNISASVAKIAKKYNSYFIHISTDHYYNDNIKFHTENSNVLLMNNYAKTKFEAEKEVLNTYEKSLIVRTNIIGYRRRTAKSFFEWLLDSIENNSETKLYTNFFTSPISVNELGYILIRCYKKRLTGRYNIASSEVISKYDFGVKTAQRFGYNLEKIKPILLENNNTLKRALTLGLDISKIEEALNIKMPTIDETISNLYKEYKEVYE